MKVFAFIFILVLGSALFVRVLFNGFVDDDQHQVVANSLVHSINNIPQLFQGSTFYDPSTNERSGSYYRPLSLTFYTAIISLFGVNAFYLHLFQILFYTLNAFLVFLILRRFITEWIALLLAVIFLVHPINSEVAAYISDAQDVLYLFFGLLAVTVTLYMNNARGILLSSLFVALSLLSKETGVLFFILILLINTYRRFFVESGKRKQIISIMSLVGVSIIYGVMRIAASLDPDASRNPVSLISDTMLQNTMPAMLLFYLKTLVFPKDLAIVHFSVVTHASFSSIVLPFLINSLFILAICALGYVCWKMKGKFYPYLFFAGWLGLGILFHIHLFFRLDMIVAERWFYFPFVGLLGLLGIAAEFLLVHKKNLAKALLVLLIVSILPLSIRTFIRLGDWKDEATLYSHDIKVEPNPLLENVYGNWLMKNGNHEEGKYYLEKSQIEFGRLWMQKKDELIKSKDAQPRVKTYTPFKF